jgi:molybdate transport system substrate-binding protein
MGMTENAIPVRIARGESVDVLIMVGTALDNLIKEGKATADSKVDLELSPIGMVVPARRSQISAPWRC